MYRSEYGSAHGQKSLCQTGEHKNTDSAVTRSRETKFCCVTDERAAPKKKKHQDLNTFSIRVFSLCLMTIRIIYNIRSLVIILQTLCTKMHKSVRLSRDMWGQLTEG